LATDIPRARLLEIKYLKILEESKKSKFCITAIS
jgi:hypothetical protein